jgi:hypothetical protein
MCARSESATTVRDAAHALSAACVRAVGDDLTILQKYDPVRFGCKPVEHFDRTIEDLLRKLDQSGGS